MSQKLIEKIKELEHKHRIIEDNLLDAMWIVDAETLKFEYITNALQCT